jgi:hypothetical protein
VYVIGNAQGYLSCGCSDDEMGGLDRVAAYLWRQEGAPRPGRPTPYVLLDAGDGLVGDDLLGEHRIVFAGRVLQLLRPAAVNLGAQDLALGGARLASFLWPEGPAPVPLVAGPAPEGRTIPAWRLVTAGPLQLGVLGLGADVESEEEAARIVSEAAGQARAGGARALLLLAATPVELTRAGASAAGGVQAIIVAGPPRSLEPQAGAGGPVILTGRNAEHLGAIDLDPERGELLGIEWVPLDHLLHTARPDPVRRVILEFETTSEPIKQQYAHVRASLANQGLDNPYVGSRVCEQCHGEVDGPYDRWLDQEDHFAAFRPFKSLHPEGSPCVRCHVVGYRELPPELPGEEPRRVWFEDGVGCEVCHGPGGLHVDAAVAGDDEQTLATIQRGSVLTAREEICAACHIAEQSPRFDYLRYLRRIRHWDPALEAPLRDGRVEVPSGPPAPIPEHR